jgi:hypothetical protein
MKNGFSPNDILSTFIAIGKDDIAFGKHHKNADGIPKSTNNTFKDGGTLSQVKSI